MRFILVIVVIFAVSCNPVELYISYIQKKSTEESIEKNESSLSKVLAEISEKDIDKSGYESEIFFKLSDLYSSLKYISETQPDYDQKFKEHQRKIHPLVLKRIESLYLSGEAFRLKHEATIQKTINLDYSLRQNFKYMFKKQEEQIKLKGFSKVGQKLPVVGSCSMNHFGKNNEFGYDVPFTNIGFYKITKVGKEQFQKKPILSSMLSDFSHIENKAKATSYILNHIYKNSLDSLIYPENRILNQVKTDNLYTFDIDVNGVDCDKVESYKQRWSKLKVFTSEYSKYRNTVARLLSAFDISSEKSDYIFKKTPFKELSIELEPNLSLIKNL
jgi:hypothetical protein